MKAVVFAALLGLSLAVAPLADQEYQTLFTRWAVQHERKYEAAQFFHRFNVFKMNLDYIRNENAKNLTYTLGMNQFGDMTNEEFATQVVGGCFKGDVGNSLPIEERPFVSLPTPVDWTEKGKVQHVKDQKSCGSCWAFSAVGTLEGRIAVAGGELLDLSEQQLVDCSSSYGNHGCNGGLMTNSYNYLKTTGLCDQKSYPYTARDGRCVASSCTPVIPKISGFKEVTRGDEEALGRALAEGPVAIALEADKQVFQFYKSGVLDDKGCGTALNHGLVLTGYGADSNNGYWMVKNSWGANWGNKGYVWLRAMKNMCGISQMNCYPVL